MSAQPSAPAPAPERLPRATEVEQHGIDTIPPEHRHSGPLDLFRIQFGGANTFATVLLGTFPIALGLSLWQAVAATVLGVLVGALFLMPMVLWRMIMTIGYVTRRGFYRPAHLQVFNQGLRGGAYWFAGGVNWRGMVAWIPAAVVGLLFANYPPLIEGPFRNAANGIDLSLVVAIGLAGVLYLAMLFAFPEPRYVFGEDGSRWVPVKDAPEPRIVVDERASAHRVRARDLVRARQRGRTDDHAD